MEGLTITCVFPEEASGYDYKSYCENLIEKVKIIQTCEERKWNLDLMIYEKPPITIKTGYVSTVVLGEEERIVFLLDANNERCPIITDTKEVKQCILGDENFPSIVEKTPFSKRAFHLTIKGYEIDYDDYTIRIGYVNSQGIPYRNILQVVYRPVVYKKDSINKIEWFAEMLALFFDNNQIEIMKKQNSEPAEVEPFGLGKYLTQKYIYLQTYIRVRDNFIKETKL